ncbi:MAG: filamentous hemagglutinin N-terminal domain-containing protein [Planctomycetes bacterium]|nr:filamentous hemagglutinin N-terminal domain-containing protein [Planctomycetota bacterium]
MSRDACAAEAFIARPIKVALIAGAAWAGLVADPGYAGPANEQVVQGDVTFIRDGNQTIIRAGDGSIINYSSFDILPHEVVQFVQPDQLSRVLNRITGPDPTSIQGTLLANGQVYFVNPAGVFFTAGAVVDVGGIYAAAGNIADSDFLARVDYFTDLSGWVVNEGLIRGGIVHLIGRHVANHGSITSERGIVTMLAGNSVLIRQHGERITIRIDGVHLAARNVAAIDPITSDLITRPGVENTGSISADQRGVILGAGDLYAIAVRNTGIVNTVPGRFAIAAANYDGGVGGGIGRAGGYVRSHAGTSGGVGGVAGGGGPSSGGPGGGGQEKVTICHIPPGNPDNAHTITVGAPAVDPHIDHHGDTVGACANGGGGGNAGNGGNGFGNGDGFPLVPGNDLATALNEEARINDKVELDPVALRALERLGIYLRALRADELVGAAKGPDVYIDIPSQAGGPREVPRIAINRLRRASVLAVVQRYNALFTKDVLDEETGELIEQKDQTEHIRDTLEAAWEGYGNGSAGEVNFRAYLESTPDEQECLVYVNGLRDLFSEMWIMGLNSAELRRSKDAVLGPVTPHNMGQDQLEQTSEIGSVS